jgi:hypothetical protein
MLANYFGIMKNVLFYGKPCFCSNLVLIRVPDFFEYFSEKKSKFDKLQIM